MVIVSPSFSALTAAVISPEGTSEARVVKAWNPFFPGETRRFFAPNAPRRTTSASTSSPLVSKPVTNTFEAVQRTPASSVTSISGSDGSPPESDAAATCHSRMPIDPSPSSSPQDWARMRSSVVVTGSKVITSHVSEARPYSPYTSSTSAHSSPSRYSKSHDFGGITPPLVVSELSRYHHKAIESVVISVSQVRAAHCSPTFGQAPQSLARAGAVLSILIVRSTSPILPAVSVAVATTACSPSKVSSWSKNGTSAAVIGPASPICKVKLKYSLTLSIARTRKLTSEEYQPSLPSLPLANSETTGDSVSGSGSGFSPPTTTRSST